MQHRSDDLSPWSRDVENGEWAGEGRVSFLDTHSGDPNSSDQCARGEMHGSQVPWRGQ
jgi:hypothetical protein